MSYPTIPDTLVGKSAAISMAFQSLEPDFTLRMNPATSSLLTLGFRGGPFKTTTVADQTVTFAVSTTNYVSAHATTGVISFSTSAYASGKIPLGVAVTDGTGVLPGSAGWVPFDQRTWPVTP